MRFRAVRRAGHPKSAQSRTPLILLRLLRFLAPYRWRITLGLALLIIDVGLELAPGFVWKFIVDGVILAKDLSHLPTAVGAMVGIAFCESVVSRSRRLLTEGSAQRYVRDLRNALFEKIAILPMGFFSEARTGDLMSRVSSDVEAVQEVVINGTDNLVANFLRLLGVVIIFVSMQPALGLATVSPIFFVGFLLIGFNRRVKPLYVQARRQLGALNSQLGDSLGGIRVVKSFARESAAYASFYRLNELFLTTNLKAITTRANLFPWVGFVVSFTNTIMLGFGAWLIVHGQFTLGGLVAYRTYGRFFYGPIDNLTQINDMLQRANAAGTRIFEVLDAEVTVADAANAPALPPVQGEIAFENVSFRYEVSAEAETGRLPDALHGIDFRLHPGERVAIVGPSGAGKSTLFALIQRFYDPTEGRVTLDGHDLRAVTQESLRRQVVAVPQDTFLFATSVRDNIRFSRPDASDEEVEAAARSANALGFIQALPHGFDTMVGERGVKLSGGQRQRIAVARAFLAEGRILLLDEATSAVEPESEREILEALHRLQEDRTTLIATHRLATIQEADRILVIENGTLAEEGTHAELVQRNGAYARLLGTLSEEVAQ